MCVQTWALAVFSALRRYRIGGGVPHILFCGCRAVPHFTNSFVRTAATIGLSSCSSRRLVLFAAGFLVGAITGCERNDAEESKSPHAPALAIIARHISHFLRTDRSEARSVGKEVVSTFRCRWLPDI